VTINDPNAINDAITALGDYGGFVELDNQLRTIDMDQQRVRIQAFLESRDLANADFRDSIADIGAQTIAELNVEDGGGFAVSSAEHLLGQL